MNENRIACVILNYNDFVTTKRLVEKIKNYTIFNEIIVVDNCSTDGSFEKLKTDCIDDAHIIQSDMNKGYGYGNNFGIKIAKEKFDCNLAVIANPDISFEESLIKKLISVYQKDEKCAVVSCSHINPRTNKVGGAWKIPTYMEYTFSSLFLIRNLFKKKEEKTNKEYTVVDCVPGSMLIVDIDKFQSVGGYDERVFLYCEETILGYKLKRNGYKTYFFQNDTYFHCHAVSTSKSIPSVVNRQRILYKSRLHFLREYLGVNRLQLVIASGVYKIALLEEYLKVLIRKIMR